MGYFRSIYDADELPHRARSVYMYLCDRSDAERKCWPSVKRISADLKLSRRTVQRALADLEKAGLVARNSRNRDNGGRTSNLYTMR